MRAYRSPVPPHPSDSDPASAPPRRIVAIIQQIGLLLNGNPETPQSLFRLIIETLTYPCCGGIQGAAGVSQVEETVLHNLERNGPQRINQS
jgi:hypothetical protein